jgi:hypothetical protein
MAIQAIDGDKMTACHHHALAFPEVPERDFGKRGRCHHEKMVTVTIMVTTEIVAAQRLSPLSPLSPLKSLPLLLRAIGVWGCHLSPVTMVTGDKPSTAPVSRGGANQLSQLSQSTRGSMQTLENFAPATAWDTTGRFYLQYQFWKISRSKKGNENGHF